MSNDKLKKLVEHRDAILLAELGALIHDLGKLSEEFISNKSINNPLNIVNDGHAHLIFEWYEELTKNLKNLEIKINIIDSKGNYQINLYDFILNHHPQKDQVYDKESKKEQRTISC